MEPVWDSNRSAPIPTTSPTHVVAHVVSDGGRVTRVVLRNASFDLAHRSAPYNRPPSCLDAAAHGRTEPQPKHRWRSPPTMPMFSCICDFDDVDAEHQQEQPQRRAVAQTKTHRLWRSDQLKLTFRPWQ